MRTLILLALSMFIIGLSATGYREVVIEDFEDGLIELESYADEDGDPDDWSLDSLTTWNESEYALKLFGNTWKVEAVDSIDVVEGDVWQVAVYVDNVSEIQGFALQDSAHTLFYSFAGSQELDIDEWVTVYQGAFPIDQWNTILLPVADDWMARFEYYPTITSIVYVNDNDGSNSGEVYFDHIVNITEDLPVEPTVAISYEVPTRSDRFVTAQFHAEVTDPDSETFEYFWSFGDGATSQEAEPLHTYTIEDDHDYTVLLQVRDDSGMWGTATCEIWVDEGETTLPIKVNFVGDIMLARRYDDWNGIINTLGVEAIFDPTLSILGEAADLTIANLECQLTNSYNQHPTKTVCFKGNPDNVEGLTYAGIDIVTIANNHILDYMEEGLVETQQMLTQEGIAFSGAGMDLYEASQPVFANPAGINMAFLMSSDRTGQYNNFQPYLNAGLNKSGFAYMTPYNVLQQIESVQETADIITMIWHAGSEYSTEPGNEYDLPDEPDLNNNADEDYSPLYDVPQMWDRQMRHFAIDNGADLVIVHHPHIIHGLEVYNGKLIAHSLGNYVFDLDYPETMPTMILNAEVDEDGYKNFSIVPAFIDDYITQPAQNELGLYILDYLAQKSKELDTWLDVDREEVIAYVIMDTTQFDTETELYEETLDMVQVDDWSTSGPIRLTRQGNISSLQVADLVANCQYRVGRERLWWGNMEDEGCTLWNLNSNYEDYDDFVAYRGLRSLRQQLWSGSDGVTVNLDNRIKCDSDTTMFTLQGYIKTEEAEYATLKIRNHTARTQGSMLAEYSLDEDISGTTDWHHYWKEIDPPDGTNFFDVQIYSEFNSDPDGYNWFDDVSLVEWEDWHDISGFSEIEAPNDYYYIEVRTSDAVEILNIAYEETNYHEMPQGSGSSATAPKYAILHGNYPNPFNPETTIEFSMKNYARAELKVYNIRGQMVRKVLDEQFAPGRHSVVWDGTDGRGKHVATGVYFYQLKVDGKVAGTRKMLLLK